MTDTTAGKGGGGGKGGDGNGGVHAPAHVIDRLAKLQKMPQRARDDASGPSYLRIQVARRPLDSTVLTALRSVEATTVDLADLAKAWEQSKLATPLSKITASLNKRGLRYDERLLLSRPSLYASIIADEKPAAKALEDTLGFAETLLRRLRDPEDGKLVSFYREIAAGNARKLGIELDEARRDAVARELMHRAPALGPNQVEPVFEDVHEKLVAQGSMPQLVDLYLLATGIDYDQAPEPMRRRMVDYLLESGIRIDASDEEARSRFAWGDYDEYFALAWAHARSQTSEVESVTPATGGWDFSIDVFDDVVDIAVEPDNILAAGFMDYAYEIGERLHVFDLMDALYLEWTGGNLDLPQSEAATKLEQLWREREARDTAEERALGYMKALGKGSVKTLDRMVSNQVFAGHWGTLMEEVARFIQKREEAGGSVDGSVSRIPIYQATKQLQHNLTEYGNGRTKSQARQLRNLLKTCFDVLDSPEVADAYGTPSRKDRWSIIERLHRIPPFDRVPNVSAIRTAANEGNRVFQWIASFQEGAVTDDQFDSFLRSAEAWIIAKSGDEGDEAPAGSVKDEGEDDFGEGDLADEEFDDFDV